MGGQTRISFLSAVLISFCILLVSETWHQTERDEGEKGFFFLSLNGYSLQARGTTANTSIASGTQNIQNAQAREKNLSQNGICKFMIPWTQTRCVVDFGVGKRICLATSETMSGNASLDFLKRT